MIIDFKCKETEKIWKGERSSRLPNNIQNVMRRKLRMLNNAKRLNDLLIPPNNRLEELKGKRKGEYSIRVDEKWHVCFKWLDNNAHNIIIEDYH